MTEFSFSHVNKNFGFKPVLKDLSFEVMTGERAALIGRNGTGKSTILKLLAGEESPDSGEISLRRGANTALLEQIPRLRGKDATVYDVLCEPFAEVFSVEAKLRELEEKMTEDFERYADAYTEAQSRYAALGGYDAETRLKNIVQGFKLNGLLERPYNVLSGGQKTVVNLAAVVLREPDILRHGFNGLARPPVFRPCGNAHAHFRGRHLHKLPRRLHSCERGAGTPNAP